MHECTQALYALTTAQRSYPGIQLLAIPISGTLDKSRTYLEIKERDGISTLPINWGGYNCPCFLVKDVGSLFKKVEGNGSIKVSSIAPLFVNERSLDVGFMSVFGFELAFEFISLRKNSERQG